MKNACLNFAKVFLAGSFITQCCSHKSPVFSFIASQIRSYGQKKAGFSTTKMSYTAYGSLSDIEFNNNDDFLISALSENMEVSVKVLTARNIVQDAMIRHQMKPLATDALGRVMICSLLMSNGLKDQETLQLTFSGDGPLNGVMAISDGNAGVRGYVGAPTIAGLPPLPSGNEDVAFGIGKGILKVVRNHPTYQRPYNGVVEIQNGEVAYDCAYYLKQSEQKASGIGAGVKIDGALVKSAAGYMIEMLPGATAETDEIIAQNVQNLLSQAMNPTDLISNGGSIIDVMNCLLDGLGQTQISVIKPKYQCQCSVEKIYRTLTLLGTKEVEDILEKEDKIEVKCEFCGKVYMMDHDDIREHFNLKKQ